MEKAILNNYTYLKEDSTSVKVYLVATDEVVVFEKGEVAETHERSISYFMIGSVLNNFYAWIAKYKAFGDFEKGSDDFELLEDIELID